jgi:MFS family permease
MYGSATTKKLEDPSTWAYLRHGLDTEPVFFIVVFLAAIVQAMQSVPSLAVTYYLKDQLELSPSMLQSVSTLLFVPWMLKPIFGFLSDTFPVCGNRRRPYLCFCGIISSVFWVALAGLAKSRTDGIPLGYLIQCLLVEACCAAMISTVVKALLVEHCEGRSQGYASFLQFCYWGTFHFSSIIAAALGGWMLSHISTSSIFLFTAIFPLTIVLVAPFITEYDTKVHPISEQISLLWGAFFPSSKQAIALWGPALFILVFSAVPNFRVALFYFLTGELHFEKDFMVVLNIVGMLFALVGVAVYQTYFHSTSVHQVLKITSILVAVLGVLPILLVTRFNLRIHVSDTLLALCGDAIFGALLEISAFPVYVLASRICPPGVEGSMYSILMALSNIGTVLSGQGGALLTKALGITSSDFSNLPVAICICSVLKLAPLFLLSYLPTEKEILPPLST